MSLGKPLKKEYPMLIQMPDRLLEKLIGDLLIISKIKLIYY